MNKPGRPPKPFKQDSDRFLAGLALAYECLGCSRRGSCEIAVATYEGLPVGNNVTRDRGGHGLNLLDWTYVMKQQPGSAASIAGRARWLRQKLKGWMKHHAEARHLYQLSNLWLFAMQTAADPDPEHAEQMLRLMGEAIGEGEFVQDRLLLLLRLTRSRPT